ncbi:VENN motif pre-toxin domain-containing protein [Ewingella sp. CoE-038-23]|uniref:VENN motif pre-toxin domain-containing protein n=1 Tax=Ewingella docleensis TaxID=3118588 RepID=UPI003365A0BE
MSQALAGGLAPYLSLAVKKATEGDPTANIAGHALAGAVIAYLQGGSVSGGAAGAAGGELAARAIMAEIYPGRSVESLSNDEKSNISALSLLSAGLAGGVAGNSLNAAGTGAVCGKVTVENNNLALIRAGGAVCADVSVCRDNIVKLGIGALLRVGAATSAIANLSESQKTNIMLAAMSGKQSLVDDLSSTILIWRLAITKLFGVKRLMKERGSPSYDFVIGSDIARDCMYVEVRLKDTNPLLVLAEIFFSDQTHTLPLTATNKTSLWT